MHHSLIAAAAALALAGAALPAHAAPSTVPLAAAAEATTQLPRGVRPLHYDIAITPDAQAASFAARVAIELEVLAPTRDITLNAAELRFLGATLTPGAGGAAQDARIAVDAAAQTATFSFSRPLAKGRYRLALDYTGVVQTQAAGLFSLDYDSAQGKKRALFTQFENSDARRMIPSWDEPAYKASFALQATIPAGEMAVSNMPVAQATTLPDGRVRVRFADSPKMSTYLLFFALGDFERATANVDGTELGVVTRRGALAQARFALDASQDILREYNDYFGVRYPLPKLDNVAGPGRSQFFSAMENWGAIFSFEYALLLDPAISTQVDRQEIFATAAHEMAHQWFGNLVTMRWWDDLWLNEGFASWMEGRMTARLHPEWNTALNAVRSRDHAMARDSVVTTHPVVQHVETVEQASQAFDEITYSKGEAVIRMLEAYVGEDAWRRGVRAYLREHAYGNTVSNDLWRHIERAAAKPVTAIAHDFTLQPGVPLIRVADPVCKDGRSTVALAQGEFSRDQPGRKPLSWRVPVIAQVVSAGSGAGAGAQGGTLVAGGKGTLSLPGCGAVVVNAGQSGYYRTLYAPKAFARLSAGFAALAPIDQLGLLSDSWALGMAGLQPASSFLDLARATPLDAEPQVWSRIAATFAQIHAQYDAADPGRQRFADYAVARLAPVMARIGWNAQAGEASSRVNLRGDLIEILGQLGDRATIAEARRRHAAMERDPQAVPPGLRKSILAVVAQHADAPTWEALREAARAETSPLVKDTMYGLLASATDPLLARRALALALTDEPGATIGADMIATVAGNYPEMAFDFAIANMAAVNQRVDATSRSRYFPMLARASSSSEMVGKVRAYAEKHLAPEARRDAETAVAAIEDRLKVRAQRVPEIDGWLQRNGI
ncbi:M1 family metallopeptidase [Massilia sp.]|uniref:M1 family metallopeptidase n=1 Tax=Massilia sp. TaxID=1882437 RepID=UPI0028A7ED89|nr:M1 family metallopeptidase [Massilia sp.]